MENRVGLIILCRFDSRRLPGKALLKIGEKEVLGYIHERLSRVTSAKEIVVATSTDKSDNAIADFCRRHAIRFFRGEKDDAAKRILDCAVEHNFDYFARVCGDNIFVDYALLEKMITIAVEGNYNFVSNVKDRSFPRGMSIEILKTAFFKEIISHFETAREKEHVTAYLYEHESEIGPHHYLYNDICPEAKGMKLALDDVNDLEFISEIVKRMKKEHTEYLMRDIFELTKNASSSARKR